MAGFRMKLIFKIKMYNGFCTRLFKYVYYNIVHSLVAFLCLVWVLLFGVYAESLLLVDDRLGLVFRLFLVLFVPLLCFVDEPDSTRPFISICNIWR